MEHRSLRLRVFGSAALSLVACSVEQTPEPLPTYVPNLAAYAHEIGPQPEEVHEYHVGEIRRNDSLSTALARLHVSPVEVDEIVSALAGVFDFRKSRLGHQFELRRDAEGRLTWFRYTASPTNIALAFRGSDGELHGLAEPVGVETEEVLVDGRVTASLYEGMSQAGEEPTLTFAFVDLFAWDVDFLTETQNGDQFRILVEKKYVDGKLIGYGRLLGGEYAMTSGRTHRAFLYEHQDGSSGYYTEKGQSVRKSFLKSPIQFASITSHYGMREHPSLKFVRAHRGVDYGAPSGTAVWAVGDGVVKFAGWQNGYGNVVAIEHANGFETRYAHLRGFGQGVKLGKRISQKQVLGYVGRTGLATGPHLHFEVWQNGEAVNPLKVQLPPAEPIPDEERDGFMNSIAPALAKIDAAHRHGLAEASLEAPPPPR